MNKFLLLNFVLFTCFCKAASSVRSVGDRETDESRRKPCNKERSALKSSRCPTSWPRFNLTEDRKRTARIIESWIKNNRANNTEKTCEDGDASYCAKLDASANPEVQCNEEAHKVIAAYCCKTCKKHPAIAGCVDKDAAHCNTIGARSDVKTLCTRDANVADQCCKTCENNQGD